MATTLEDKDTIREIFARYALYADSGQCERYAGLFTEDCTWDAGSFGHHTGRAALLSAMQASAEAMKAVRHHVSNLIVEVHADSARARGYVAVITAGETPTVVFNGCYVTDLVRRRGQWLISHHRLRPDLAVAAAE